MKNTRNLILQRMFSRTSRRFSGQQAGIWRCGGEEGGKEEPDAAETISIARCPGLPRGRNDRGACAISLIRHPIYTMGRKTRSLTGSSVTTTTTVAKPTKPQQQQQSTDVTKPPLKALFKLWCLKKCARSSTPLAPRVGCEAVTANNETTTQKPAWMRDGNLDATLWKQLPVEILEHILGFLPFPNVFRCATVCQQWRAICQRPRLHLNVTNSWPSFCPVRYGHSDTGGLQWCGFSIATNKWQAMPAIDLPASPGKSLVTGAGGLLAICRPRAIIVVVNPVTGERRALPEPIQKWSRPDVLHMIAEPQGGYKIILAGTEAYSARKPQPTEVYDSVTGRWSLTGSLPADLYLDPQDGALDGNGRLVCTAQKALAAGATLAGTDALVVYDVPRGVWSEVASDLPDESARQTPLATNGRTLMAVAPVDDDGPIGRLYALNSGRWELLASMPEPLHRRVRSWGACVVSGHHVVVVSDTAQGCVVSYDLSQGTWSERRSPIKFSSKVSRLSWRMRLLAPISFRPDVLASP